MDFDLSDEQRMIQEMVADFSASELAPHAAEIDRTERFPIEIYRKLNELGLCGMNVPEEYGGSGAGAVALSLALTEITKGDASVGVTTSVTNMVAESIFRYGNEEQRKRFLPLIFDSDHPIASFALTEPQAGSDAGNIQTRAIKDGDHYVLNGTKLFITSGAYASVFLVLARTLKVPGAKGISAFVIPQKTPGLIIGKEEKKMGLRGSNTVSINLEDCRVPASNLIGDEGNGFQIAMSALDSGRIGIASQALGIGLISLKEAMSFAKERIQFGKPISELQAIQFKLADIATLLETSRLLIMRAASLKDSKKPFTLEACMAKVFSTEAANKCVSEALQIHGGYGYVSEYPIERHLRDVKVSTIYEGTSEIQRLVISRRILQV